MNGGVIIGTLSGVSAPFVTSAPAIGGFDINAVLVAIGAAGGGAAAWKIVGIIVDKLVPSRSDKRSEIEVSMNALAKTIEILSAEKVADAATIARANARIVDLETTGSRDYELIRALRDTISDLEAAMARKDAHIAVLAAKLAEYGLLVTFDQSGKLTISPTHRPVTGPVRVQQTA